jgi:hypothetical protein
MDLRQFICVIFISAILVAGCAMSLQYEGRMLYAVHSFTRLRTGSRSKRDCRPSFFLPTTMLRSAISSGNHDRSCQQCHQVRTRVRLVFAWLAYFRPSACRVDVI